MGIRESLLNTITSVADSDFVRIVTSAGASSKATVRNLFKGFESNLGAKSSLTTSDYIRVVGSDNESYKQLVSGVADVINPLLAKVLSGDHDANTYSTIGLYYCGGWSNQPTGASAAGYLMVLPHRTDTSYKKQIYSPYSTNDLYIRTMNGGTWTAWEKMPTRAELTSVLVSGVPTTSAVSSSNIRYARCGKVITVSGWIKCDTNPSLRAVLFTLPKSPQELQITAYDQNTPNAVPGFTLRPNGNVEAYQGSYAGHYVNFAFTYITTND